MLGNAVERRSEMCCRWERQQRDRLAYDPFLLTHGPRRKEGRVANSCFKPTTRKRPAG
jgi:hypothetical protein